METGESQSPKLEYNLAGGLLLTIRENDLKVLTEKLVTSGYRYGCVLPFRGLVKEGAIENLQNSPLSIVHFEEAWNPTKWDSRGLAVMAGLYGQVLKFAKLRKQEPILQDVPFPGKATCERLFDELLKAFPKAKFISHIIDVQYPSDRLLVEVNPGINKPAEQILAEAKEKGIGLVFDPSHLLVSDRTISVAGEPVKPNKGEWERQFKIFASQIEVVDINPPQPTDVGDLLKGGGLLKEVAQAAREAGKVEFIRVEVPIPPELQLSGLSNHQKGFDFLQAIGQRLMEG